MAQAARFIVCLNHREQSRHNLFTVAKSRGVKLAHANPHAIVDLQDTRPDDGDPYIWRYAGRGCFRVVHCFRRSSSAA